MAAPQISLAVGSDALGWAELGAEAALGVMTKSATGGDGSLDWTLAGEAPWKYRNQLQPGARVRLRINGEPLWTGRLVTDATRYRLKAGDPMACAAAGLLSWAARCQAYGYAGIDTDLAQWFRTTSGYSGTELETLEDSGKFSVDTEGRLLITADGQRTFDDYAKARLNYYLFNGLDLGAECVAIDFDYKCYVPSSWEARIVTRADPWAQTGTSEWTEEDTTASWTSVQLDFTNPQPCVQLTLFWNALGSDAATTSPYVKLRNVVLYFRMDGANVDRTITLGTAMGDVASLTGFATVLECDALTSDLTHVMVRPELPKTMADALHELAGMVDDYVEWGFGLTFAGEDSFFCRLRPAAVNAARNTLWSYGGHAGEDTDALERDAETAPDYVRLLYKNWDDAAKPKIATVDVWYPSDPGTTNANVLAVTDYADTPLPDTTAAAYAKRIYNERRAAQWSGTVPFSSVAHDSTGKTQPSWRLRPGDRLVVPALSGAGVPGLYVSETAFDFASMTGSATVGHPWDVWSTSGIKPRSRPPAGRGYYPRSPHKRGGHH
jgi:hypothetical protein